MVLFARSLTEALVTLAAGRTEIQLPASGEPVNVTSRLRGLAPEDYDALEAQRPATVAYSWTNGIPEFDTMGLSVVVGGGGSGGNTVMWAPFAEPTPDGAYAGWSDALAALQAIQAPVKYLHIIAGVGETVQIPGGTHDLTGVTLVGVRDGADTDDAFRGYQDLLYVTTAGDDGNPTWLRGLAGMKNLFFRQQDGAGMRVGADDWAVTDCTDHGWTGGPTSESPTYAFSAKDVGKYLRIGFVAPYQTGGTSADTEGNNGTFRITEVISPSSIRYERFDGGLDGGVDANNDSIIWSLCTSAMMVEPDRSLDFTLDCADFRDGGDYNWGSLFVPSGASAYIHLMNHSSVRWFSLIVDGYVVIESLGGACWVGSLAFCGNGNVEVFAMADTLVRSYQSAINSWTLHQGTTVYLAGDSTQWAESSPATTVAEALDRLAAACNAAGHAP